MSKKRQADMPTRAKVREEVLRRDRECQAHGRTPVKCGIWSTDVHELLRGANRQAAWLNPDLCRGVCRSCHSWITEHPTEARDLGLALRTGDDVPDRW